MSLPKPLQLRDNSRDTSFKSALVTAGLAFGWLVFDLNFGRTFLVTPINAGLWWTMSLVGIVVGGWVGLTVANRELRKPAMMTGRTRRIFVVTTYLTVGVVFGTLIANRARWRIANTYQFWNSSAPIASTAFPIRSVRMGRGGPMVSIGSQGQEDWVPVSKEDLELLGGMRTMHRPWEFCLNLRRQEKGGAVRVWRPETPRLTSKDTTVIRCPKPVREPAANVSYQGRRRSV
jgi:hypothetical protein